MIKSDSNNKNLNLYQFKFSIKSVEINELLKKY